MLARRLLLLSALLLLTGVIAAALAPQETRRPADTTATDVRPRPPRAGARPPPSVLVRRLIHTNAEDPPLTRARVGQLLELSFAVDRPTTLSIDGYDRIEAGDRDSPARFDFIARRAGRFPVRRRDDDATVATLEVGPVR